MRSIDCEGRPIEVRPFGEADQDAALAFARGLPEHDLLFLSRDITQPRVVAAWARDIAEGSITSLLAWDDGEVVGTCALVRDPLSWSPHVGEVRVLLSPDVRGCGLGALLAQAMVDEARALGLRKLTARMTVDQVGAVGLFEALGFRAEAMLRDQAQDRAGGLYDVVVLAMHVARADALHGMFTAGEELGAEA